MCSDLMQFCRLWDVVHGTCQHKISLSGRAQSLDFHPSGNILMTGCDDGQICLWSIPDSRRVYNFTCSDGVTSVAWNMSGDGVAAACRNKSVYLITINLR